MSEDAVTFGLASAGYLLLAKDTALRIAGRRWPILGALTAVVVIVHVALVWTLRFEWSLSFAWEKSPAGFLIFHAALLLIAAAPLLRDDVRGRAHDRVTIIAFCIVSTGVLPAPFRYPELAVLAIPHTAAFLGVVAAFTAARRQRRPSIG